MRAKSLFVPFLAAFISLPVSAGEMNMKVLGCAPAFWSSETFATKISEVTGTKAKAEVRVTEISWLVDTEHKTQLLYTGDVSTFVVNVELPKKGVRGKCEGSYRHWKTEDKPTCTHAVLMVCDVPESKLSRHHWTFETSANLAELPEPSMAHRFVSSLKRKLTLFPEAERAPAAESAKAGKSTQSAK